MKRAVVILPVPIAKEKLIRGGRERLVIGGREFIIGIPAGWKRGQRIRLPHLARYIDPKISDGDIHLLVLNVGEEIHQMRRDVYIELPLPAEKMIHGSIERINLGQRRFDVKIPAGISPGKRLRLRGLAEYCNEGYVGDVFLGLTRKKAPSTYRWGLFRRPGKPVYRTRGLKFKLPFFEYYEEWFYQETDVELDLGRKEWRNRNE